MTWTLTEGVVDSLRDYLRANFDTKCAALNVEYDDGIELDPIFDKGDEAGATWHVGEKTLESLQQFPVGFVLGGPVSIGFWNDTQVDAGHEITVAVIVSDQDYEVLRRKLYRTQRAIWECLVDAHFNASLGAFKMLGSPVLDVTPVLTRGSIGLGEASVKVRAVNQETRV